MLNLSQEDQYEVKSQKKMTFSTGDSLRFRTIPGKETSSLRLDSVTLSYMRCM